MIIGDDPDDIPDLGEYIDALSFVRALFDDPLPEDAPSFVWSEGKGIALGGVVIQVLKATARALGKDSEAEIDEYVSGTLDRLITQAMAKQAGLSDSGD